MTATREKVLRRAFKQFVAILLGAGILLGGLSVTLYRSEIRAFIGSTEKLERFQVALLAQVIEDVFEGIVSDLLFLTQQNELLTLLDSGADSHAAMAAEYLALSREKRLYDQIRFLDDSGLEQVRVNFNAGAAAVVPRDALQDKSRRYYFTDVFALEPGQIFVSPFDLNIERGAVEQPFKPMIRVGTPVSDASGRKRGIVLLNYLGSDLLGKLSETAKTAFGDFMLLNAEGYWLLSPQADDEWGFMLPDRANQTLAARYPAEWKQIQAQRSGQLRTENGLFTFAALRPLNAGLHSSSGAATAYSSSEKQLAADAYVWFLVLHVPEQRIAEQTESIRLRMLVLAGSAFVLIATGAWFLALAISRRRAYQARLVTMAHYDALTGLPNRSLFFDRLEFVHRNAERYRRSYGVLYIDLDGFKDVNDSLGHDAGDGVLIEVAKRLKTGIRGSDTVARLGGDELAVILSESSGISAVLALGEKLIASISEPIQLEQAAVRVGASIGAAIYPDDGATSDQVLARADQAMYVAKSQGKGVCLAASETSQASDN